jgi:hypothetical protein
MSPVETYILDQPEPQQSIMQYLHELIMGHTGMRASIRYKIPFYDRKSWICYLNPTKDDGVELAFTRANELSNEQGLLNFRERKQVAGVVYYQLEEIEEAVLLEVLQEALLLDETVKYNVKK